MRRKLINRNRLLWGALALWLWLAVLLPAAVPAASPPPGTSILNTAVVTYDDANGSSLPSQSDSVQTIISGAPVLKITKLAGVEPVSAGATLTYSIQYENTGNSPATSVTLTDALSKHVIFQSASGGGFYAPTAPGGTVSWNIGTLSPGQIGSVTIVTQVKRPADYSPGDPDTITDGTLINDTATLNAAEGSDSQTITTTVGSGPSLTVVKSATTGPIAPGGTITYSIHYENRGNAPASNVRIQDMLPAGTALQAGSITGGGSIIGQTVTWQLGALSAGASGDVGFKAVVSPLAVNGQTIQNTAIILSNELGVIASNTTTHTVSSATGLPSLSIVKTDTPDPVYVNNPITYTIAVTNDGTASLTDVVIRDPVPANTTFVNADGSGVLSGSEVTWLIPSLAPGATEIVNMTVQVDAQVVEGSVIQNTAQVIAKQIPYPTPTTTTTVSARTPAQIAFLATGMTPTQSYNIGDTVCIAVTDLDQNKDPAAAETVSVTLEVDKTSDVETLTLTETGTNTGIFTQCLPSALGAMLPENGTISVSPDSSLTVTYTDPLDATPVSQKSVLIDPYGIVFDSVSGAPLAGFVVTLRISPSGALASTAPGWPAGQPDTVTTDATGAYAFPLVPPGSYYLDVTPAAPHTFPSTVPSADMPPGFVIGTGSRGEVFTLNPGDPPLNIDLPADPPSGNLSITKTANKNEASIGDFVSYAITINNSGTSPTTAVKLYDTLPCGFAYMKNSSKIDGTIAVDPANGSGRTLIWSLGTIAGGASKTVTYTVVLGPNSPSGDGKNSAYAGAETLGRSIISNIASKKIKITDGVFTSKGTIIGKVFMDLNGDALQQWQSGKVRQLESGIPSVVIYMEDGTRVETDSDGKFSFYGVKPGTHVLRVDTDTLPKNVELVPVSNRFMGSTSSQFVDMVYGQIYKANFAAKWKTTRRDEAPQMPFAEHTGSATSALLVPKVPAGAKPATSSQAETYKSKIQQPAAFARSKTDIKKQVPPDPVRAVVKVNTGRVRAAPGLNAQTKLLIHKGFPVIVLAERDNWYQIEFTHSRTGWAHKSLFEIIETPMEPERKELEIPRSLDAQKVPEKSPQPKMAPFRSDPMLAPAVPDAANPISTVTSASGDQLAVETPASIQPRRLEELIKRMSPDLAILSPQTGDVIDKEHVDILIKAPLGGQTTLLVNHQPVSQNRIGRTIVHKKGKVVIYEYVSIGLDPGRVNTIATEVKDPFGNIRGQETILVTAVGRPDHIDLRPQFTEVPADGRSCATVQVSILDKNGFPIPSAAMITVTATAGKILETDRDPMTAGHQLALEKGRATFTLQAPFESGEAEITVFHDTLKETDEIFFKPHLRDLFVVGFGEITLGSGRKSGNFESPDRPFHDDAFADGKAAAFVKGDIGWGVLMTAAYDSGKEETESLFRTPETDLSSEGKYPIYGDESSQQYEAMSREKLYVRLEKDRSSLLFGDFDTNLNDSRLGAYTRSFNGFKSDILTDRFKLRSFVSHTDQTQVVDSLPGKGVSGYYYLAHTPVVDGSEKIVLETRSRRQPGRVLKRESMTRWTDYDISYDDGAILFREPIPSRDADFNPVYIIASYETRKNGTRYYIYGGRGAVKLTDWMELGVTDIVEQKEVNDYHLIGGDVTITLPAGTTLKTEWVQTDSIFELDDVYTSKDGDGLSVEIDSKPLESLDLSGYYQNLSNYYDNPSAADMMRGTEKYGLDADYRLMSELRLRGKYFNEIDDLNHGRYRLSSLDLEKKFKTTSVALGLSHEVSRDEYVPASSPTSRDPFDISEETPDKLFAARISVDTLLTKNLSLQVGHKHDLQHSRYNLSNAGLSYKVDDISRVYARNEFGKYDGRSESRTLLGIESDVARDTVEYSEYRMDKSAAGSRVFQVIGLRNKFKLAESLTGNVSMESLHTRSGDQRQGEPDGVAFATGLQYLPTNRLKLTSRLEYKDEKTDPELISHMVEVGLGYKLHPDYSLLVQERYSSEVQSNDQGQRILSRTTLGLAYRPANIDRFNALAKIEMKHHQDTIQMPDEDSNAYIGSVEGNYQVNRRLQFSGKYAGKLLRENDLSSYTDLVAARFIYDLTHRIDMGAEYRLLTNHTVNSRLHGGSLEAGYRLIENLWLSLGYSFDEFDADLTPCSYWGRGPYLRIRFKFDEETVRKLKKK